MRVLVVEDERKTAAFIRRAFKAQNMNVDVAYDGRDALDLATYTPFDAIVLDIMLPGRDGLSILGELRRRANTTPVLLLSARGETANRVEGLNSGADDYLAKPFAVAELVARVRALIRRRSVEPQVLALRVGDLTMDTITRDVHRGRRKLELTAREYRLLEYLMRCHGRICSRISILENVWDYGFDPGSNVVEACVKRLRAKLETEDEPPLLHTVRGVGYVLKG